MAPMSCADPDGRGGSRVHPWELGQEHSGLYHKTPCPLSPALRAAPPSGMPAQPQGVGEALPSQPEVVASQTHMPQAPDPARD